MATDATYAADAACAICATDAADASAAIDAIMLCMLLVWLMLLALLLSMLLLLRPLAATALQLLLLLSLPWLCASGTPHRFPVDLTKPIPWEEVTTKSICFALAQDLRAHPRGTSGLRYGIPVQLVVNSVIDAMGIDVAESRDAVNSVRSKCREVAVNNRVQFQTLGELLNKRCNCSINDGHIDELRQQLCPEPVEAIAASDVGTSESLVPSERATNHYQDMDDGELRLVLAERDNRRVELEQRCHNNTNRRSYDKSRCDVFVSDLRDARQECAALRAQVNLRTYGKRHVSVIGGYTLTLKRNVGHTACRALANIVAGSAEAGALEDPSSCLRFEHQAAIAQQLMCKSRAAVIAASVSEPRPCPTLDQQLLAFYSFFLAAYKLFNTKGLPRALRQSPSNMCTWLRRVSADISRPDMLRGEMLGSIGSHFHAGWCDMQVVRHGTGLDLLQIMGEQLQAVGVPTVI